MSSDCSFKNEIEENFLNGSRSSSYMYRHCPICGENSRYCSCYKKMLRKLYKVQKRRMMGCMCGKIVIFMLIVIVAYLAYLGYKYYMKNYKK
jgi:predicted nucleic acid-binding Zn ribbon protein